MSDRLQKILARAGVASRRRAEELIAAGRVAVNGKQASLGDTADVTSDVISVDGRTLPLESARRYIALHKPPGYISSVRDEHGDPSVLRLVADPAGLFPVGRLDKETSGLLLISDDGEWANLVTHPRYEIEKEYEALVRGRPRPEVLEQLRAGVVLPDGTRTAPARVEVLRGAGANTRLSITVIEGKKRQIRLMASAVGHPVLDLRRVRVGDIRLGDLEVGAWRELSREEVQRVRERAGGRGPRGAASAAPRSH